MEVVRDDKLCVGNNSKIRFFKKVKSLFRIFYDTELMMRLEVVLVIRGGDAKGTSKATGDCRADALLFSLYFEGILCASQVLT